MAELPSRTLALETSGTAGSIAFLEGRNVVAEFDLPSGRRTAQTLAPTIKAGMSQVRWTPAQIDLVAVTIGPGSFTGLRIGVMTAKALAYATGAKLAGINTLEVLAHQAPLEVTEACVVMDAYRDQLFCAGFRRDASQQWRTVVETHIVDAECWLAEQGNLKTSAAVIGPAVAKLRARRPAETSWIEQADCQPQAATVGELALRAWSANQLADIWRLTPRYYRPSAAEEKRLAGGG